jgi:hypothetical protein
MPEETIEKIPSFRSKVMAVFKAITKVVIFLVVAVVAAKLFAILGAIHGKDLPESYFYGGYPTILALLDSEVFMGLIFFITLSVFAYVGYLLWELHEVAVHKAEASSSPQIQLIFALSLCGLFIHKAWWVLAIIIAFTSWEAIGNSVSNMIHKGATKEKKDKKAGNKVEGDNA